MVGDEDRTGGLGEIQQLATGGGAGFRLEMAGMDQRIVHGYRRLAQCADISRQSFASRSRIWTADNKADPPVPESGQVPRADKGAFRIVGKYGLEVCPVVAAHQADDRDFICQSGEAGAVLARGHDDQSVDTMVGKCRQRVAFELRIIAGDAQQHLVAERLQPRLHHLGHHLERCVGEIVDQQPHQPRLSGLESARDRIGTVAELARNARQALLGALARQSAAAQRARGCADRNAGRQCHIFERDAHQSRR